MKKTLQLICVLVLFVLFGFLVFSVQNRTVRFDTDANNMLVLSLQTNDNKELLYPWFDESSGLYYFFLPSFVDDNRIYFDSMETHSVFIDGESYSKFRPFTWEPETTYELSYEAQEYPIVFMKSANLPTLFLDTDSGSMAYLDEDKTHEEPGDICLVDTNKNVEYKGALNKISARGNSTFYTEKKPYSFTLKDSYPLCGLDAGKKWNLLALYYEYDKLHTKLVSDMAEYLDMEYNCGCTWVDLYCNGEYQGLYMLTEAVTVGEGRVDIHDLDKESETNTNLSGGYLIEREREDRLEADETLFTTDIYQYLFTMKSPKYASPAQLDYIKNYIQNIENLLAAGDEHYKDYIDLDSFAKQFLIDKVVLEPDAMQMSAFYYKDKNSDLLKAGPLWDYDRAFGTSLPDYTASIEAYPDSMNGWYMPLYEDEAFYGKMMDYYEQLLPYFEELLNTQIDAYAEMLTPAVVMDTTRRPVLTTQNTMMSYAEYDSYVTYLKYFLANRLNYLNEQWNVDHAPFAVPSSTEEYHTVNFILDDGTVVETRKVKDGDILTEMPALDDYTYSGWQFYETGNLYNDKRPIYEDITFTSKIRFTSEEEKVTYLLEKMSNASSLQEYMERAAYDDFSLCIYINGASSIAEDNTLQTTLSSLSAYQPLKESETALSSDENYFLLIDNGWQDIWECTGTASLNDLATTFGPASYGTTADGKPYLHILNDEINYLENAENADITFVVIKRMTGSIEQIAAFKDGQKLESTQQN